MKKKQYGYGYGYDWYDGYEPSYDDCLYFPIQNPYEGSTNTSESPKKSFFGSFFGILCSKYIWVPTSLWLFYRFALCKKPMSQEHYNLAAPFAKLTITYEQNKTIEEWLKSQKFTEALGKLLFEALK